jgi:hypothetical protein
MWSSCISHDFTMSHWSSGLTICFPPQGAAVRALGLQPTFWNWDYLFAQSRYSGYPDVIPEHRGALTLRPPTLRPLMTTTQTLIPQNLTTQKRFDYVTLTH